MFGSEIPFLASALAVATAIAALVARRSVSRWCFAAGMLALALDSTAGAFSLAVSSIEQVERWQTLAFAVKSVIPGLWLCFALTYSRGNYREFLSKWKIVITAVSLLPMVLWLASWGELIHFAQPVGAGVWIAFTTFGQIFNAFFLISAILIIANLERTVRAAVGTMRWRIKYPVVGVGTIFGARIYTHSQALLFAGHDLSPIWIESSAIAIGCLLVVFGFFRSGFDRVDIYPSGVLLNRSVTILIAGSYLFVVGVLAQIVARLDGAASFKTHAFLVLVGTVGLAVLLLSDRLRQQIRTFVSRHLRRPQHDSTKVWRYLTQKMANVLRPDELCAEAAELISSTFDVLSVTILLADEKERRLFLAASTSRSQEMEAEPAIHQSWSAALSPELKVRAEAFYLEDVSDSWADSLKQLSFAQFPHGGKRLCIPLVVGDRWTGIGILSDRVRGTAYCMEELDLLKCLGDQVAAGLLNLRLTEELMASREMEAFQSMSAFFVHDLKNAASSLSLMLQNMKAHYHDPDFRSDALRGLSKTVVHINQIIERLGALRNELKLCRAEFDPNELLNETIDNLHLPPEVQIKRTFQPVPRVCADREMLRSVLTNILLNARDAMDGGGRISARSEHQDRQLIISIADNGCGMDSAFIRECLFRPFQTTKKKGLGIGMYQSRMIVEAHGGQIHVESDPGKGTTFSVFLPLQRIAQ